MRRLFLNPLWLFLSLPCYIGCRLLSAWPAGPLALCLSVALLTAFCLIILISVRARSIRNQKHADGLAWIGLLAMGFFSSLFVLALLRDLVLLGVHLMAWAHVIASAQVASALAAPSARAVLAIALLTTVAGLVIARLPPRIVNIEIPVAGLPEALHGFSIAQISDLHVGPTIKRGFVAGIVDRVNALNADLIAVTGDMVDGSVRQLSRHTAPLAGLTARHGAYFVTGNHEYYSGEAAWTREFQALGFQVLKNEHVVLSHDGASLVLAGVTDYGAHHFDRAQRSDPAAAMRGAPADAGAKILLAHQPSSAAAAADAGFDVQLSGHTHGGQFWPWNWFVRFFQPYADGLHRLRTLWVYVSRGTGYWGPPNRFGVPSEITFIRLRRPLFA